MKYSKPTRVTNITTLSTYTPLANHFTSRPTKLVVPFPKKGEDRGLAGEVYVESVVILVTLVDEMRDLWSRMIPNGTSSGV